MGRWQALALRHASLVPWLVGLFWLVMLAGLFGQWWRYRESWIGLFFLSVVIAVSASGWARWRRERVIRETALPQFLKRKLRETYPLLSQKDADLVERGLRQFFLACSRSQGRFVAMPSRAVDAMWHEFILHTRAYRDWCALALGRFLHHTPAEVLGANAAGNDGLRRAWYWACKEEAIDPRRPTRLPLLFALDGKLAIADGFRYLPDCRDIDRQSRGVGAAGATYCATDFASGAASGDADGFGGAQDLDGSADGASDAGGDGGCGGGD